MKTTSHKATLKKAVYELACFILVLCIIANLYAIFITLLIRNQ